MCLIFVLLVLFIFLAVNVSSPFLTAITMFFGIGFFSVINPLTDTISTDATRDDKSKYSKIRATGTLGFVIILLIFGFSGFPNENSNIFIFLAIFMTCFACLLYTILVFKIENGRRPSNIKEISFSNKIKQIFDLSWCGKLFLRILLVIMLLKFSNSIVKNLLSAYLIEDLQLGNSFTYFVALGSLSELLLMLFLGKLLKKNKIEPWLMIMVSAFGLAVWLLIYYFFHSILSLCMAQILHSLSFGASHIGTIAFISEYVKKEHTIMALGIYFAIGMGIPEMFESLFGGIIIELFGYSILFISYAFVAVVAGAICFLSRKLFKSSSLQKVC